MPPETLGHLDAMSFTPTHDKITHRPDLVPPPRPTLGALQERGASPMKLGSLEDGVEYSVEVGSNVPTACIHVNICE